VSRRDVVDVVVEELRCSRDDVGEKAGRRRREKKKEGEKI